MQLLCNWLCPSSARWARQNLPSISIPWAPLSQHRIHQLGQNRTLRRTLSRNRPRARLRRQPLRSPTPLCPRKRRKASSPRAGSSSESWAPARRSSAASCEREGSADCTFSHVSCQSECIWCDWTIGESFSFSHFSPWCKFTSAFACQTVSSFWKANNCNTLVNKGVSPIKAVTRARKL